MSLSRSCCSDSSWPCPTSIQVFLTRRDRSRRAGRPSGRRRPRRRRAGRVAASGPPSHPDVRSTTPVQQTAHRRQRRRRGPPLRRSRVRAVRPHCGRRAPQSTRALVSTWVDDSDRRRNASFREAGISLVEFFRMTDGTARIYRFGPFVLDVADRSLKRQDVPISLTPKTFDLLVTLVEHAGRLVEKDALLRTVWPDVAVEEGNLTKGVFSLRQLLEEDEGVRYIETVPK